MNIENIAKKITDPFLDNLRASFLTNDNPTARQREVADKLLIGLLKYRVNPDIRRRGSIPRSRMSRQSLTDQDLLDAGFKKSIIAVPETGQSSITTYRHPISNLHFHKHPDNWLYHEDKYPALSMVMEKYKQNNPNATFSNKLSYALTKAIPESASHIVHEGLPGWVNWISGTLSGEKGFNSTDTSINIGELGSRLAAGTGILTGIDYIRTGGDSGLSTAPEHFATLASFVGGNRLAHALYQNLVDKDKNFERPGTVATAILAGIPVASAVATKYGTRALVNRLLRNKHNEY